MALREPQAAPYRLRPAGPFDLDEVARIEAESFPIPWKREFFASELVEPHRYIRVLARDDGATPRIGGYLFAVALYEEFHINKIATDLRLRKQGHGRALLEDALARARSAGSTAITLEVRGLERGGPRVLQVLRLHRRLPAPGLLPGRRRRPRPGPAAGEPMSDIPHFCGPKRPVESLRPRD